VIISEFWEENAAFRNLHVLVVADGDPAVQAASCAGSVYILSDDIDIAGGLHNVPRPQEQEERLNSQHLVLTDFTGHFDCFCLQYSRNGCVHGLTKGVAWRMDIQTHLMCR